MARHDFGPAEEEEMMDAAADENSEKEEEDAAAAAAPWEQTIDSEIAVDTDMDKEAEEEEEEADGGYELFDHQPLDEIMQNLLLGLSGRDEERKLEAVQEMRKLLAASDGGRILHQYIFSSPKCAELWSIWEAGSRASTALPLVLLLTEMLRHGMGRGHSPSAVDQSILFGTEKGHAEAEVGVSDQIIRKRLLAVQLRLDKLAHTIVQNKLKDIYSHLSSGQRRRENAALYLMSAIVLRGRLLAKEVASKFDFTLEALRKLAQHSRKGKVSNKSTDTLGQPTRKAFVQFAMAFIWVGDPSLLRWILQKRTLYAGVLHGLAKDDETVIVEVLGLMKVKVLHSDALVPSGIQCAMFGDAALDQLAQITSDQSLTVARSAAHSILLALCTEPGHGLCSDPSADWEAQQRKRGARSGGEKRLLRLMLRLRATEADLHKELLLAIATSRTSLAAAYIDAIPFSLEPRNSPNWFEAIALVSRLISIANVPPSFSSMATINPHPPPADSPLVQSCLKRIWPHNFSRVAVNRGLLHPDPLVKRACLVLLLEALKSFECLQKSIKTAAAVFSTENSFDQKGSHQSVVPCSEGVYVKPADREICGTDVSSAEVSLFVEDCCSRDGNSQSDLFRLQKENRDCQNLWLDLAHHTEDRIRMLLPDTRTILSMYSSLRLIDGGAESVVENAKQKASPNITTEKVCAKRRKVVLDDVDSIQVIGVKNFPMAEGAGLLVNEKVDSAREFDKKMAPYSIGEKDNINESLYIKLLQVLAAYQRALPVALADHNFDAFKLVPENLKSLSFRQQRALVDLLQAATVSSCSPMGDAPKPFTSSLHLYRNFKPLLNLMMCSHAKEVKSQATFLAYGAMVSTGAFDDNISEVALWLSFLRGWDDERYCEEETHVNSHFPGSSRVILNAFHESIMAFLWDAVFSVGKNLYKYLDQLHSILSAHTLQEVMGSPTKNIDETRGLNSPEFGPFVVCVLDKYKRIIHSDSKGFKLPDRAAISVYLAYVLDTLLQAQANPKSLAVVICSLLSGDIAEYVSQKKYKNHFSCEWGPLLKLYGCTESLCGKSGSFSHHMHLSQVSSDSGQLMKVLEACAVCEEESSSATAAALARSLLCTCPLELLKNFPWVLGVCKYVFSGDFSVLAAILNANRELMSEVIHAWPGIFEVEMAATDTLEVSSNGIRGREFFRSLICREQSNQVPSQELSVFAASGFASFLKSWSFFGIFPAAASSNRAKLLTSSCMINYIQSSLLRLSSAEIPLAVRVVSFWIEQLLTVPEVGEVDKQLETCFMLLKQIILPFKGSSWWKQKELGISFFEELITNAFTHPMMYEHFLFHERAREEQNSEEIWSFLITTAVNGDEAKENAEDFSSTKSKDLTVISYLHPVDRHLVQIMKGFLSMCWFPEASALFSWNEKHIQIIVNCVQSYCRPLIARAFDALCNQLQEEKISNKQLDSLPVSALYAVLELAPHVEPFHLVCFLQDFFLQFTDKNSADNGEINLSKQSLGLHLAKTLFKMFSSSSRKWENSMRNPNWWAQDQVRNQFSLTDLIPIFENILKLFITNPSDNAASCILSALEVVGLKHSDDIPRYKQISVDSFPEFVVMIPVEILAVCMQNTTKIKAKLVHMMIGASPIHFSEFGRLIALTAVDEQHSKLVTDVSLSTAFISVGGQLNHEVGSFSLSNEDLRLLLPAAHYYLTCSKRSKVMITSKVHNLVQSVYRRFLIRFLKKWDKEFDAWGRSILSDGFPGEDQILHSQDQILHSQSAYLCSEKTLVGKALAMLHDCLLFQPLTQKKRHSLFCRLLPKKDKRLLNGLNSTSLADLKIAVISFVARSAFLLLLLSNSFFSPLRDAVTHNELLNMEADSDVLVNLKGDSKMSKDLLSYFDSMVYSLDTMYQSNLHMNSSGELKHNVTKIFEDSFILIIEESVLTYLLIVSKYMELVQRDEKFVHLLKSFTLIVLRHRFGDYLPTITLRCLFSCLRSVELPILASAHNLAETAMELAVTHSQFVPLLFSKNHSSVKVLQGDSSHTALTSILGLLSFSETYNKAESLSFESSADRVGIYQENQRKGMKKEAEIARNRKLQLVKLLRVLYSLRRKGIVAAVSSIASDELLSLLLIAYTASMSKVDQEIFSLMHEIESSEGSGFAGLSGMDYLWGEAAFKRRDARVRMKEKQDVDSLDMESIEEFRKRMIKEDLVIDPRKCGLTVLHFPTKRSAWIPAFEPKLEHEMGLIGKLAAPMEENLGAMLYDPAFILPFSLYGLSTGSIDVEDFINRGLLAIAFASTSSISNELRKLGYEVLSTLMRTLQEGLSFKGKSQIQLLLIFFKNAITEPWQRIPNIFAVFSAEASCILMHPDNPHYLTINRFLLREPGMDLENVPLFQKMFGSGSMHFRSERIWMLNLLTAGLTSSLDTRICRRQFLLEILMSFFSSTISDGSTRKQILQVVKRAAKVPSYALYLVDTAGLLSWLASVAVNKLVFGLGEHSGADVYEESTTAIQVIEILLTCRQVEKWALTEGMEELSKVAMMLHRFLFENSESACQHIIFKRPVLRILMTVLRLSQRQKRYQIHFSLSLCAMQEIIQWVEVKSPDHLQAIYETRIVALWTLLQTSPPSVSTCQEKEVFYFVLWWATMVIMLVVQKNSATPLLPTLMMQNAKSSEEKLDISRLSEVLLRWTSRALLLGRLSNVAQANRGLFSSRTEKCVSLGSIIMSSKSMTSPFDGGLARLVLLLQKVSHAQGSGGSLEATVNALASLSLMNQSSFPVAVEKDGCFGLEKSSDASHAGIDMLQMLLGEIPCPQEVKFSWRWSVCSPWEERLQVKLLESSLLYEYEVRKIVLLIYQQICTLGRNVPYSLSNWKASRHLFSENHMTFDIEDQLLNKDVAKQLNTLKAKLSQLVSQIL